MFNWPTDCAISDRRLLVAAVLPIFFRNFANSTETLRLQSELEAIPFFLIYVITVASNRYLNFDDVFTQFAHSFSPRTPARLALR